MRGQQAAGRTRDFRQRGEFGGLRDHAGKIAKSGGEPDRAVAHRLLHHRAHRTQLFVGRRAGVAAHHAQPDTAVPGEMRHVDGHALPLEMVGEFRDPLPSPIQLALAQQPGGFIQQPVTLAPDRRGREAAVAADKRRDALEQERFDEHGMLRDGRDPVGVRVQVDEAGRDDQPARVDFVRRGRRGRIAGHDQRGDLAGGDRNVGGESCRAAAVDYRAVADYQVVFHGAPIVAFVPLERKPVPGSIAPSPGPPLNSKPPATVV